MGCAAVTGLTRDLGCKIIFDQTFSIGIGRRSVDPAGDIVQTGGVTADTVKILTVDPHMDIQSLVGFGHGRVEIAVFDTVTAAAIEMTRTAVLACGKTHTLNSQLNF